MFVGTKLCVMQKHVLIEKTISAAVLSFEQDHTKGLSRPGDMVQHSVQYM